MSVKRKSRTANVNTDSQCNKQEACSACGNQVWLAVNHNTSATSGMNSTFEAYCMDK